MDAYSTQWEKGLCSKAWNLDQVILFRLEVDRTEIGYERSGIVNLPLYLINCSLLFLMLTINLNKFGSAQFVLCLIQMIMVKSSIVRFDDKLGKSKSKAC